MGLETALTVIGLAASAAGTGVSIAGARAQREDMNKALRAGLARQEEIQRKATPVVEQNIEASGSQQAGKDIQSGTSQAAELYRRLHDLPTSGESPVLLDRIVQARNEADIGRAQQAEAELQGFGNLTQQQWLRNLATLNQLGVLQNFSRGSVGVVPYQIQAAMQPGQNLQAVGSLLGTGGTLAGMYGQLYPTLQQPTTVNSGATTPPRANINPLPVGGLTPVQQAQYNAWKL